MIKFYIQPKINKINIISSKGQYLTLPFSNIKFKEKNLRLKIDFTTNILWNKTIYTNILVLDSKYSQLKKIFQTFKNN